MWVNGMLSRRPARHDDDDDDDEMCRNYSNTIVQTDYEFI